jgi:hypothetical protein
MDLGEEGVLILQGGGPLRPCEDTKTAVNVSLKIARLSGQLQFPPQRALKRPRQMF